MSDHPEKIEVQPETEAKYREFVDERGHPTWTGAFDRTTRLEQFQEDLEAGKNVPGLLTGIAFIGLVLAFILLTYVTYYG